MKPTQPYRAWRAIVGSVVIATVIGLWAHAHLTGTGPDMLWDVVVLALVIASGYAVFGRRTMQSAVQDAQDIASDGTEEDDATGE